MKPRIMLAVVVFFALLLTIFVTWFYLSEKRSMTKISSFEECMQNGYPVFLGQCSTPDGRTFNELLEKPAGVPDQESTSSTHPLISVSNLTAGETVTSPLRVTGLAKGFWFFEASFPVELRNADNVVIATAIAEAQGDWMTEDSVPFVATLSFKNPVAQKGTLILRKDNPSGLAEHDDSFAIPIMLGVSR